MSVCIYLLDLVAFFQKVGISDGDLWQCLEEVKASHHVLLMHFIVIISDDCDYGLCLFL